VARVRDAAVRVRGAADRLLRDAPVRALRLTAVVRLAVARVAVLTVRVRAVLALTRPRAVERADFALAFAMGRVLDFADGRFGTPASRSAIATACFWLFTLCPLPPLESCPRLYSRMTR
jgi:hypothetical protein